ncbi:MAG: hypothetical protein ACOCZW_00615 [Bacteroidota bacterium]
MNFFGMEVKNRGFKKIAQSLDVIYKPLFDDIKLKWNMPIRNFYSKSMGVSLTENSDRLMIPVNFMPAPTREIFELLNDLFSDFDFDETEIISDYLENALKARKYFTEPYALESLNNSIDFAQNLQQKHNINNMIRQLFNILGKDYRDIFGSYSIFSHRVEIYLLPCIAYCKLKKIDLDVLLIIVLAHELAHGYNHIGRDKDGCWWRNFYDLEVELAESLANYYTNQFIQYYNKKIKGIENTFNSLVSIMPEPYGLFRVWDAEFEQVFSAFIEARRNNTVKYDEFLYYLSGSKKRIKKEDPAAGFQTALMGAMGGKKIQRPGKK